MSNHSATQVHCISEIIACSLPVNYRPQTSVYREKNTSLYLLCDDYVLSIADGTSVSTVLCTRKLGPEEVSI